MPMCTNERAERVYVPATSPEPTWQFPSTLPASHTAPPATVAPVPHQLAHKLQPHAICQKIHQAPECQYTLPGSLPARGRAPARPPHSHQPRLPARQRSYPDRPACNHKQSVREGQSSAGISCVHHTQPVKEDSYATSSGRLLADLQQAPASRPLLVCLLINAAVAQLAVHEEQHHCHHKLCVRNDVDLTRNGRLLVGSLPGPTSRTMAK